MATSRWSGGGGVQLVTKAQMSDMYCMNVAATPSQTVLEPGPLTSTYLKYILLLISMLPGEAGLSFLSCVSAVA